ncbi:SPOR domain-containing protein [Pseudomonadota bacterium]
MLFFGHRSNLTQLQSQKVFKPKQLKPFRHHHRGGRICTAPLQSLAKSPPVISKPATKPVEKPKTAPQAKKRVKVTVTKAIPAKSLASGYYIQLGAFKDSTRAQKLSKKLASTWKTHITSRPNGMLAVWNGPYATFKEASLYREKITSTTKLKGFVVKH